MGWGVGPWKRRGGREWWFVYVFFFKLFETKYIRLNDSVQNDVSMCTSGCDSHLSFMLLKEKKVHKEKSIINTSAIFCFNHTKKLTGYSVFNLHSNFKTKTEFAHLYFQEHTE